MRPKTAKIILAGWLIDGSGGPIRKNQIIGIKKGCIDFICDAKESNYQKQKFLDLSHCTLLPGLIDCHTHLCMSGSSDPEIRRRQLDLSFEDAGKIIHQHLKQYRKWGIIAVRDGGDRKGHTLQYKLSKHNKDQSLICVKTAGRAFHQSGRYGKLIGRSFALDSSLAKAVKENQEDIDHLKLVNSGLNSLTRFGVETAPQFSAKDFKKAVKIAKNRGLSVMVHANGKKPVQIAIGAGCTSIEHGFFMGEDNLNKMAQKKIIWIPTAITMQAYFSHLQKHSIKSKICKKNLEHQLDQIRLAREKGVITAIGTDAGSQGVHHGSSVQEEIKLFISAGYSISQAVKCACFHGATLLNLKNKGLLVKDRDADFIAFEKSPDNLFQNIIEPDMVCLQGNIYKRSQFVP